MKRDWELIRKIMLAIEDLASTQQQVGEGDIKGYAPEVVSYHIMLLGQASLVKASCHKALGSNVVCNASHLTWQGHEFLDKIRNQSMWNKTLMVLRDKGLDLSFDTIKAAAASVATSLITG